MKRLFIAVKVEPGYELIILHTKFSSAFQVGSVKWVELHNMHITLKFLGETSEEKIPSIINELKAISCYFKTFETGLIKTGIFGSSYSPKVIWLGLDETEMMTNLALIVIDKMNVIGFVADSQNFVPHLTLGRVKLINDKKLFQNVIAQYKNKYIQKLYVDKFYLIESVLHKDGPTYNVLETFELKKR